MYAVIETGGKQYRVEVGTELEVELLDGEPGESITLDRVLLVADGDDTAVGQPVVANAAVEAEVVRRDRGDKVIVFKYRPKARRRVKKGHRQDHTVLRITDVTLNGRSAAESARKAEQDAKTERQRLEEAAARQAAADAELAAKLAQQKPAQPAKRSRARAAEESATDAPQTSKPRRGVKPAAGTATPADSAEAEQPNGATDTAEPADDREATGAATEATDATAAASTDATAAADTADATDTIDAAEVASGDTANPAEDAPGRAPTTKDG